MQNRYKNILCPVCGREMEEAETVVCPDCGAPHHRECYKSCGHCFYADKHGTDEQFVPPPLKQESAEPTAKCPNCGYDINPDDEVCEKCLKQITLEKIEETQEKFADIEDNHPFFRINGLDKDETIDGQKVSAIAHFVGYNAMRYINIFKRFSGGGSKISWNWVAFLSPHFWLISRKCYGPGILMGFFAVLTNVLSRLAGFEPASLTQGVERFRANVYGENGTTLIIIMAIVFIVHIMFGLFGDYIYKRKVFSSIKELNKRGASDEFSLIRLGGVNLFLPVLMWFAIAQIGALILTSMT